MTIHYRIIFFIVTGLFSTLFCATGFGQNKQTFEQTFEKETSTRAMGNSKKFKNVRNLSYYPDTLPSWFFNPPQTSASAIYAVGISDPDMELAEAKKLALYRAKVMAGLYSKSKMQYFRDVYTSEEKAGRYTDYRQRFDTYFKISTWSMIDDELFALVDTHFTRYNEYVALVKYTPRGQPDMGSQQFTAVGTVLYIEAQVEDAFEVQAEYELQSSIKQANSNPMVGHYLYREKGNKFLSNSQFMGALIDYPVYIYRYASPAWKENVKPLVSYNGLWSIFARQLLRDLTLTTEQSKIKVKNLGQQYSPETTNLSREVASTISSFFINGIEFANDSVKMDITVQEVN